MVARWFPDRVYEMKRRTSGAVAFVVALGLSLAGPTSGGTATCRRPEQHEVHTTPKKHRYLCKFKVVDSQIVSKTGGLGSIAVHGKVGAVLQRDEGIVAMLDLEDPTHPRTLGTYSDDAQQSFDGDLAFSHDGQFLFYARQTHQFSRDGVHVLDVSDPTQPALAFYQASGGTLRIAYYFDGTNEYVIFLDAVDGLVVTRFERQSGALVELFRDPGEPASKVGGPASAGLVVDPKDPITGSPLLYVATGGDGLEIYDLTDPTVPVEVGSWPDAGLAEIEVVRTATKRTIYAAPEYWFDKAPEPEVFVLDATDLGSIEKKRSYKLGLPTDQTWRVQGMARAGSRLLVAHSHAGLVAFTRRGSIGARALMGAKPHLGAGEPVAGAPAVYAMDVEKRGKIFYLSDAATGALTVLRLVP